MSNIYQKFTNQYQLTKTLRFELKPTETTLENFPIKEILASDRRITSAYKKMKPFMDEVHDKYIQEALNASRVEVDWVKYHSELKKLEEDTSLTRYDLAKKKSEIFTNIRKEIFELLKSKGSSDTDKLELLFDKKIFLEILKIKNDFITAFEPDSENNLTSLEECIKIFTKMYTFWGGYNENRRNYYSEKEQSTAVAFRIINENFVRYIKNYETLEKLQELGLVGDTESHILSQVEVDKYSIVKYGEFLTQPTIEEYNKILDINKRINEYKQKTKIQIKINKLLKLHRQIGSVSNKEKFIEIIENNSQLYDLLAKFIEAHTNYSPKIFEILQTVKEKGGEGIFISKTVFTSWFYRYIRDENRNILSDELVKLKSAKYDKKTESYTYPKYINLFDINTSLAKIEEDNSIFFNSTKFEKSIIDKNLSKFETILEQIIFEFNVSEEVILEKAEKITLQIAGQDKIENLSKEQKEEIKDFSDNCLMQFRALKTFKCSISDVQSRDEDFYEVMDEITSEYKCHNWYDLIRNFLTKKSYSTDKLRLTFGIGTLMANWTEEKNVPKSASEILKINDEYFLCIQKKKIKFEPISDASIVQKFSFKQFKGDSFAGSTFVGMTGLKRNKKGETSTYKKTIATLEKGEKVLNAKSEILFSNLEEVVNLFQKKIESDYMHFNGMDQIVRKKYNHPKDLLNDLREVVKHQFTWENISEKVVFENEKNGDLYLFKITSKDFYKDDSHRYDLQTIILRSLFEEKTRDIKLSANALMFWRDKSIEKKQKKVKGLDKSGKTHEFEIIENKRFTDPKFLFHIPVALNTEAGNSPKINEKVNLEITKNNNVNIIGIDRGENHLLYYSLINQKGEIIKQESLNIIEDVDYHQKLIEKEQERLHARENWDTINKIADLKNGYIAKVVRKLIDTAIENNAIIVMEDLNTGFKRGRQKIERSIYQKFELALAKKLNFDISKNAKIGQFRSLTNALQITPQIGTFSDIKKQCGVIYYVNPNWTSQTDPITGFFKNLYISNEDISMFEAFNFIKFDKDNDSFKISYNQYETIFEKSSSGKSKRIKDDKVLKEWILSSDVERWRNKIEVVNGKKTYNPTKYNPTVMLKELFNKYGIGLEGDIIDNIKSKKIKIKEFYKQFKYIFDLICQTRNKDVEGNDFILSPVDDISGKKFDSRNYTVTSALPDNGDANGAYNIARKGLMMINRIYSFGSQVGKIDQYISDLDWSKFATGFYEK